MLLLKYNKNLTCLYEYFIIIIINRARKTKKAIKIYDHALMNLKNKETSKLMQLICTNELTRV